MTTSTRLIILAALKCAITKDGLSDAFVACWQEERQNGLVNASLMRDAYQSRFPSVEDVDRVYREVAE
jgi:hypothetical protein